ncbi:hypothetical protein [Candidatus Vesicomyidisocius calyptogenae]|uniref:Uncharacterized protein n=1 Tax=Vesicomyosocius okutanii subsp. Calyptogena okutanii (strain HA) TaxID=412965 RepID=A5CXY4_VESOH|nr:hypothetical protein [Candidatus Vesicomyosocius okutanii]BAF61204.1 hypothetical protein COSY_0068 [Candidatus Vesicomyosocius okutanii]
MDTIIKYKYEMDRINSWMEDCYIINQIIKASGLYKFYKNWTDDDDESHMKQHILDTKLSEREFLKKE